jgi:NRPS condensation-like uncharacterized protein
LEILNRALTALVSRHESLRTRIVNDSESVFQEFHDPSPIELEPIDLASTPLESRETRARECIERFVNEKLSLTTDELFAMRLLRLDSQLHVLVVTMDHIVSDFVSIKTVLEELWMLYEQGLGDRPLQLPEMSLQFGDYAVWQCARRERWADTHGIYWDQYLDGAKRVRLLSMQSGTDQFTGVRSVPVSVESDIVNALRSISQKNRTTLALSLFTLYAVTILRWCNESDVVMQFFVDGRNRPALENMIGFMAARLYLRITLSDADTFTDLLRRVSYEYYNSYDHVDSYRIIAKLPRPELTYNPAFSWLSLSSERRHIQAQGTDHSLEITPQPFSPDPINDFDTDDEPALELIESAAGITGSLYYNTRRFTADVIEELSQRFSRYSRELATSQSSRVSKLSPL